MSVNVISVETSTPVGSVALLRDGEVRAVEVSGGESHSVWLLKAIDRLLMSDGIDISAIDGFGICIGPGSFMGLRIGISIVKGLAAARGCPCVAVVSLDAMADSIARLRPGRRVVPVIDARRGEVYCAVYEPGEAGVGRIVEPAAAAPLSVAQLLLPGAVVGGTGVEIIEEQLEALPDVEVIEVAPCAPDVALRAAIVLEAGGGISPALIEPLYLRKTEAELRRDGGVAPTRRLDG